MKRAVPLPFHAGHPHPGRERDDELILDRARHPFHDREHHAGLHPDQDNLRFLCDLGVLCGDRNPQLFAQRRPRRLVRLAHQNLRRRTKFRAHQAAHDGARQLAAADETEPIPQVVGL